MNTQKIVLFLCIGISAQNTTSVRCMGTLIGSPWPPRGSLEVVSGGNTQQPPPTNSPQDLQHQPDSPIMEEQKRRVAALTFACGTVFVIVPGFASIEFDILEIDQYRDLVKKEGLSSENTMSYRHNLNESLQEKITKMFIQQ